VKILAIGIFLFSCFFLQAQREAYNWIWGRCDGPTADCSGWLGSAVMRFSDDSISSVDTVYFPSSFQRFTTAISDSNGNFLMAFNQKYLFDNQGGIIREYSELDAGNIRFGRQSGLFLRLKNDPLFYYLFNTVSKSITPPLNQPLKNNSDTAFFLTKIRVSNNQLEVVTIDTTFINDTIPGGQIHACRHANGRDWWLFKSTFNQKKYLRGLLTPNGLTFEYYDGPGPDEFHQGGRNLFSPDGTKFFHYMPTYWLKMHVYDFDRCTGELSNFREIDFEPWINDIADFNPYVLSPDASKIYLGRSNEALNNYETIQVDVETGVMTVVADSVYVPCLTPNLKWVISGLQDTMLTPIDDLNVLLSPNNSGQECERVIWNNYLPVGGFIFEQPEWANHLLGPIVGSICDTLGIDDETSILKLEPNYFLLYPNPSNELVNLKTNLAPPLEVTLRNTQGQILLKNTFQSQHITLRNEVTSFPSGLYYIEVKDATGLKPLNRKWMKLE
jgi:hypothetical protein